MLVLKDFGTVEMVVSQAGRQGFESLRPLHSRALQRGFENFTASTSRVDSMLPNVLSTDSLGEMARLVGWALADQPQAR
jgi:hypothetical protein